MLLSLCASVARAQSPAPSAAEQYFNQAQQQFNAGRYDEAIVGYQAAYRLTSLPEGQRRRAA